MAGGQPQPPDLGWGVDFWHPLVLLQHLGHLSLAPKITLSFYLFGQSTSVVQPQCTRQGGKVSWRAASTLRDLILETGKGVACLFIGPLYFLMHKGLFFLRAFLRIRTKLRERYRDPWENPSPSRAQPPLQSTSHTRPARF